MPSALGRRGTIAGFAGVSGSLLGGSLLGSSLPAPLHAQQPEGAGLPDGDLRIVVGFIPGSVTDIAARSIAAQLERRLRRRVWVENHPGIWGAVAGRYVKDAVLDGTVLALLPSSTLVARLTAPDFPFNPELDLTPVSLAGAYALGFAVSRKTNVSTFKEYLQWLQEGDTKRLRIGDTGTDAINTIITRLLGKTIGVDFERVAYVNTDAMLNDLEDGRLQAAAGSVALLLQHDRGYRLRLLMTSGPRRLIAAPEIPTFAELGYAKLETIGWFAFFANSVMRPPMVNAWNREIHLALSSPELQAQFRSLGMLVQTSTPQELGIEISDHMGYWRQRLQDLGIETVG
jgi:tripartite-type tricarboxylate transporter receptor subunit TctC